MGLAGEEREAEGEVAARHGDVGFGREWRRRGFRRESGEAAEWAAFNFSIWMGPIFDGLRLVLFIPSEINLSISTFDHSKYLFRCIKL